DILRSLGLDAYRLSVEWSRIEPEAGRYDETALDHYRRVLLACRSRGITPMVTLHHFTNPRWFSALGGWERIGNVPHFVRFARLAGERYGDLVDLWTTINEPEVLAFHGYDEGIWPPGVKDRSRALEVIANLLEAHGLASAALRETDRVDADGDGAAALIGVAKHWALLQPLRPWMPLEHLSAAIQHRVFNVAVARALCGDPIDLSIPGARPVHRRVDALRGSSDFLGVNYYTRWMVSISGKDSRRARPGAPVSDLGWEFYPEGLERALTSCASFGLPLYITENGIADGVDRLRPAFIRQSLAALDRARARGADVRGYFHWSLLDNFEWDDGFHGRFGLCAVDFEKADRPRTPRPSARIYAEEIEHRRSPRS
ncbi:MAG TPA: family 1 glycosylhydrolase, partial [Methylomirabilota bacterium]|nr:family 1 glycosylhydrolase [Methylomirabilota bacterium]